MTCISATGGTLNPPSPWIEPRRYARTTCRSCGARYPTGLVLSRGFDWHLRHCPARPLDIALKNLNYMAERPPAAYIVDQELALVRRRIDERRG